MSSSRRLTDLSEYVGVLPYASELFGVYQPLLGWKSKQQAERINSAFNRHKKSLSQQAIANFSSSAELSVNAKHSINIEADLATLRSLKNPSAASIVIRVISNSLLKFGKKKILWERVISEPILNEILSNDVPEFYKNLFSEEAKKEGVREAKKDENLARLKSQINYETSVAALLLYLVENELTSALEDIFVKGAVATEKLDQIAQILESNSVADAYLNVDKLPPSIGEKLKNTLISPISVVHLFRQYFFELDTFLGPSQDHVWLSPGSSVELVEEHSVRDFNEQYFETSLDITQASESSQSLQQDISNRISEDNSKNVQFGASVTASYTRVEATASYDLETNQNSARENTHDLMRSQSEKLSSEIRKHSKTTFRAISESTDFLRKRYLLANTTSELINYELRRKMRQVAVQVQDIGSYLCWHTFVDDPGRNLGIAKLLHIAKDPETEMLQAPEEIPMPETFQERKTISIPFVPVGGGADNRDEIYVLGRESDDNDEGFLWTSGDREYIQYQFNRSFICKKAGYQLSDVEFDPGGYPVMVSRISAIDNSLSGKASFTLQLDSADFQGQNSIPITVILHWQPTNSLVEKITSLNLEKLEDFKEEEREAYESAYIESARDRVNAASNITKRDSHDLREEERIVVYRKLIRDLLGGKVPVDDDSSHHVASELVNSLFDVNKMLYFVAPEWWRPRLHKSRQQLHVNEEDITTGTSGQVGGIAGIQRPSAMVPETVFSDEFSTPQKEEIEPSDIDENVLTDHTSGWGGTGDGNRDSYFITENSQPARFGSSLGWLLQLDGDDRRNAFLNAPWVKAILPIRPGQEKAAIAWLQELEGKDGIDKKTLYKTDNPDEKDINGDPLNNQPLIDVLNDLAAEISKKHKEAKNTAIYPKEEEVAGSIPLSDENTVTATPIDRVYEHGFFPLENSFRAIQSDNHEIFDQWIEILPTDQVVPVEVSYDPITGRLKK